MDKYIKAGYDSKEDYIRHLNEIKITSLELLATLIELGDTEAIILNTVILEQIQTLIDLES